MRLPVLALLALLPLYPAIAVAQATLNKCIDAQGLVTYTNQPCKNAREVRKVEIDPPPLPDQPKAASVKAQEAMPAVGIPAARSAGPTIQIETQPTQKRVTSSGKRAPQSSAKKCDTLSDKLGRTLDKMDQARRKGYTLDQMNKWNEEIRALEREKQQSGCF